MIVNSLFVLYNQLIFVREFDTIFSNENLFIENYRFKITCNFLYVNDFKKKNKVFSNCKEYI